MPSFLTIFLTLKDHLCMLGTNEVNSFARRDINVHNDEFMFSRSGSIVRVGFSIYFA